MTAIDWSLSPRERWLLERDCRASGVAISVTSPEVIDKVITLASSNRRPQHSAATADAVPSKGHPPTNGQEGGRVRDQL